MIRINIFEAKAKLSEYLDRLEQGERVVICKRNRPIAELRPIEAASATPRPIGGAKGQFVVPASFFEPLPEDVIEGFYPRDAVATQPTGTGRVRKTKVAERQPPYGGKPTGGAKERARARRRRRQ